MFKFRDDSDGYCNRRLYSNAGHKSIHPGGSSAGSDVGMKYALIGTPVATIRAVAWDFKEISAL
jgi:hypothetical protein